MVAVVVGLAIAATGCGRLGFGLLPLRETPVPRLDAGNALAEMDATVAEDASSIAVGRSNDAAVPDAATPTSSDAQAPDADASTPVQASPTTHLVRGFASTCALSDDQLLCWGANDSAQLGLGDTTDRLVPTLVPGHYVAACGGEFHMCAIERAGTLMCWGDNAKGELGVGDITRRTTPTPIAGGVTDWTSVACNGEFTCALRSSGALYCWGENKEGALGQNDAAGSPDIKVPTPVAVGTTFRMVSAGQGHTCAIRDDGALFCWGRNSQLQLGVSSTVAQRRAPVRVGTTTDWKTVAAGQEQTCAVRTDNSLWCWGTENGGMLGLGVPQGTKVPDPRRIGTGSDWNQVSSSRLHGCATTQAGASYCWGRGVEGQLGTGNTSDTNAPVRVGVDSDWQQIEACGFHTCARRTNGSVYCWGANDQGRLGQGDMTRRSTPTKVAFP